MTIEKTFEWLFKRFQNPTIKPCPFDLECLKFLAEWVNREKENELNQNVLFAKLYCHVFIQEINFYKDFEFAQKSMNDILKHSVESHYELFNKRLNDYELNRYLTNLGIDIEKRKFDEEGFSVNIDAENLAKANNEQFMKFTNGAWTTDQTRKSLNAQISESINRFKNIP